MKHYDPLKPPDPERWRSLDEQEQIDLVHDYHRRARIRLPNATVHAVIHVVVENQIALGDENSGATYGATPDLRRPRPASIDSCRRLDTYRPHQRACPRIGSGSGADQLLLRCSRWPDGGGLATVWLTPPTSELWSVVRRLADKIWSAPGRHLDFRSSTLITLFESAIRRRVRSCQDEQEGQPGFSMLRRSCKSSRP